MFSIPLYFGPDHDIDQFGDMRDPMDARCFSFGSFVLIPQRQVLLRNNAPVRIGIRAMDLLTQFVQRAGVILEKRELMALVWADTFVDDSNLKVTMAALRKVLDGQSSGRSCIATVIGRGYRFVETVTVHRMAESTKQNCNVPDTYGFLIGRGAFLLQLLDQISRHRIVTIVGAPGAGKSSVAAAAARRVFERDGSRICFVDVSSIDSATDNATAIASILRLDPDTCDPTRRIMDALGSEDLLLVLDGCEARIESIAVLAESLVASCPRLRMLVTSREPLHVPQERVVRLSGLDSPPRHARMNAAELERYPAVQLFLTRSNEGLNRSSLGESQAVAVSRLCADLGGIPLAIEFTAALVQNLGLSVAPFVATDEFFHLHSGLRRRPEHHRSLAACLDRSLDLLTDHERLVLLKLCRLAGSFDLDTAIDTVAESVIDRAEAIACLASLVSKSLIEKTDSGSAFRLLQLIRVYASKQLASIERQYAGRAAIGISGRRLPIDGRHPKALSELPRTALCLTTRTGT